MMENDQTQIYGDINVPEGTGDRPLVTFALFAYNQERYIHEAVEGAFSQSYSPLEIILSDDCSNDRTFEIMQEMAGSYIGPHQVKVVRTPKNIGILEHFLLRTRESRGEIIVCAAGDDVSVSDRCRKHAELYFDKEVMAVSSGYDLIDEYSEILEKNIIKPLLTDSLRFQRRFFSLGDEDYTVIQGATASYRKKIFDYKLPPWRILCSEDNLMNYLIYANGYSISFTPHTLVKYRRHEHALTNRATSVRQKFEFNIYRKNIIKQINTLRVLKWLRGSLSHPDNVNLQEINKAAVETLDAYSWAKLNLKMRLARISGFILAKEFRKARWGCLRLLGSPYNYQPLSILYRTLRVIRDE